MRILTHLQAPDLPPITLTEKGIELPSHLPTSGVIKVIDAPFSPTAPRAVIYARYSSDKQRDASIQDQVRLCRDYSRQLGWNLTAIYYDREFSGRRSDRPAYQRLIEDAKAGSYRIVVTEAIDRLSRSMAHLHGLYDHLTYWGLKLSCPGFGEMTQLHIAILGAVAEMYLKDLGAKTKRAQVGRVELGRVAAGLAYGYRALPPVKDGNSAVAGDREIIPEEAEVIRRIFLQYAAGISPETIAIKLNLDGILGPGGRPWRNTTIRGQARRGTGLLNNRLYIGELVWNRTSYVADPDGRRQARVNPESEHVIAQVPHLRIIDQDLWERVKERQGVVRDARAVHGSNPLNGSHRPKYLLAGLLRCCHCGAAYTIMAKDRYGCANHRRGTGTCPNAKTITRQQVETRVLDGLRGSLMAPERVSQFQAEVRREIKELRRQAAGRSDHLRQRLGELNAAIGNILHMVELGNAPPSVMERLRDREAEKARVEEELASYATGTDDVIELMPNLAEVYARKVANLTNALNDPAIRDEATSMIRQLVEKIVVTPDADAADGVRLEIHGAMAEILALAGGGRPKQKLPGLLGSGSQLSVVAGAGFEPATFRL